MEARKFAVLCCLLAIVAQSVASAPSSAFVFFLDSFNGGFVRRPNPLAGKENVFSAEALGTATAALLGLAPPSTDAATSAMVEGVLHPDPFKHPQAVSSIRVVGIDPEDVAAALGSMGSATSARRELVLASGPGAGVAAIAAMDAVLAQRAAQEEQGPALSLRSLSSGDAACDAACLEQALLELGQHIGVSYKPSAQGPLLGVMSVDIDDANAASFHLSREADRELAVELAFLLRAVAAVTDASSAGYSSTMFTANMLGAQAVFPQYGRTSAEGMAASAVTLRCAAHITNVLSSIYQGSLVSELLVVDGNEDLPLRRHLEETGASRTPQQKADKFTGNVVAVSVTVLFVIASLAGAAILFNMQLSKDTLLYARSKVD